MNFPRVFSLYYKKKSTFINLFQLFYKYPLNYICNYANIVISNKGVKYMWHISGYYKKEFLFLVSALFFRAIHSEYRNSKIYL